MKKSSKKLKKDIDKFKTWCYNIIKFNAIELLYKQSNQRGDVMAYDYSKLNGRIVEVCGTQAVFAERMGLSERTISLKVNNKIAWKQPEMQKAAEILHFPESEIQAYFFTMIVQ